MEFMAKLWQRHIKRRLSLEERQHILDAVHGLDTNAEVRLFGSRVRDDARGGDIDLLVISETLDRKLLRSLRLWLQDRLGLRKIDVVVSAPELPSPFARLAFEEGVPL
jgi:predicted nucleotidyltransferase